MKVLRVLCVPACAFVVASGSFSQVALAQPSAAAPQTAAGAGPKEALPAPASSLTTPQKPAVTLTDAEFVRRVEADIRYEIEAARLAAENASNAEVKDFAGRLVLKDGEIFKDLEKASSEANLAMPAGFTLDAAQRARLDALKGKAGAEFDVLFKADMIKVHDDSLALLTLHLQNGNNTKLLGWTSKTIPAVQKRRDMLKEM